jgi:putative ABC transport system permease protein
MDGLLDDIQYAARKLRKAPGFTAVVVVTLGLAIGATTSIFSVVSGVVLKPLPFHEPENVHFLGWQWEAGSTPGMLSPIKADYLQRHADGFEAIGAFSGQHAEISKSGDFLQDVQGFRVSSRWFEVIGESPEYGRHFLPEEDQPGAARVAILTRDRATDLFDSPRSAVGQTVLINDSSHEVIGVLSRNFDFPGAYGTIDFLVPLQAIVEADEGGHNLQVLARQGRGVHAEQLDAELERLSARFRDQYPRAVVNDPEGHFARADYRAMLVGDSSHALWSLLAAVACVLLIAVINIAVLMMTRARSRKHEFALRGVLGASRGRLTRQLLVESSLLGVAGSLLGILLAWWMTGQILGHLQNLPRSEDVHLDGLVLLFAIILGLLSAVLFGMGAATAGLKLNLLEPLKVGSRATGDPRASARSRGMLISLQAALAVFLLAGAALSIATFSQLRSTELGFNAEGVALAEFGRVPQRYTNPEARWALHQELLERARALPGVKAAATWGLPFRTGLNIPVTSGSGAEQGTGVVEWRAVSPGYFEVLEMRVLRGRAFDEGDRQGTLPVVIVNSAFESLFFSGQEPLGQLVQIGYMNGEPVFPGWELQETAREMIGVVGNVRELSPEISARPTVYVPIAQVPEHIAVEYRDFFGLGAIIASGPGQPSDLIPVLDDVVRQADPGLPLPQHHTIDDLLNNVLESERVSAVLMSAFAVAALVLTAIGLYGTLAYSITQRYREIGLRVSVGATPGRLVAQLMFQGLVWVGLGLALGVAGALLLERFLSSGLPGLGGLPLGYLLGSMLPILTVCALASYLPARRGASIDPVVALRE